VTAASTWSLTPNATCKEALAKNRTTDSSSVTRSSPVDWVGLNPEPESTSARGLSNVPPQDSVTAPSPGWRIGAERGGAGPMHPAVQRNGATSVHGCIHERFMKRHQGRLYSNADAPIALQSASAALSRVATGCYGALRGSHRPHVPRTLCGAPSI